MGESAQWRERLNDAVADAIAKKQFRSQAELAKAAEISDTTLSEWLRGPKTPTLERFLRLCKALKAHPAYILSGWRATQDVIELSELLQQAPESLRQGIRQLIEDRRQRDGGS